MSLTQGLSSFGEGNSRTYASASDIAQTVNDHIQDLLAEAQGTAVFTPTTPLMAMGLSSLDLMTLRERLIQSFHANLHATFFFQYSNAQAITDYFVETILHRHLDWIYTIEFRALLPTRKESLPSNGLWVVFADKGSRFATPLCHALHDQGQQVITLNAGLEYSQKNAESYVICPTKLADYNKVFDGLAQKNIEGIVYLWGLEDDLPEHISLAFLQKHHRFSCEGVVMLIKALRGHIAQKNPRLWVINESTQGLGGERFLVDSPLSWLTGAIMTEHPELDCHRLILENNAPLKDNVQRCIDSFKSEGLEEHVMWLNGVACAGRLIRLKLPETQQPVVLSSEATYVIVGGCGGLGNLGLYVSLWHLEHGAKKLLMLDPEAVSRESIEFIQSLRDQGAQVDLVVMDVTNKDELARVLKLHHQANSPIKGITHVLGLMDDDKLINLDWARFEGLMQYKREVAWDLHELSLEMALPLEHFLLFSAIGSIMGSLWRSSRSAANGFLSALSHYRRAQGLPALAIDWGPWGTTIAASDPMVELNVPEGLKTLNVKEGMELLTELYHSPIPEVVAVDVDWSLLLKRYAGVRPLFYDILSELGLRRSEILLQLLHQEENAQKQILQQYIKQHLKRILFKPAHQVIDATKTLEEIGVDDLRLEELKNNIHFDFGEGIALPSVLFQGNLSLVDLAEGLLAQVTNLDIGSASLTSDSSNEPIAIIGMACRLPGAKDYQAFWSNLINEVDSITEIPPARWDWKAYYGDPKTQPGKTNIKWGGFIEGVDEFDPLFFNIAPKEAEYMDPQHRLFLQTTWHAMEDAGYSSQMLAGKKVGVYAGVSKNDYSELMREQHEEILPYISTGTVHSILANRVSYLLDLHGPSESVDTACSSALVALHSAISDLRSGESTMAFVGGVNALLSPTMYLSHSRAGFLSEDGRCKSFDSRANGYVRGEGVAVLLLKPLREALKDGDAIHAVIRSAAVNHGGKSSGLTAPSINAQAQVIEYALEEAQLTPEHISFIEVHGTGTPLGDPVEIEGLKKAFSSVSDAHPGQKQCLLGAVKTNIGHCESVSGMAGVFKMVLAMKNKTIPANLHFQSLNPKINLDNSPFALANTQQAWRPVDYAQQKIKRRGGVSSFGMGGANAHVILEEAPAQVPCTTTEFDLQLIPLSARKGRLQDYVKSLANWLDAHQDKPFDLASLAYTLQTGRDAFEERAAFLASSQAMLITRIQQFLAHEQHAGIHYPTTTRVSNAAANTSQLGLDETAAHWVQGGYVDWSLYWGNQPQRMNGLPGYPFLPLRCWFNGKVIVQSPTSSQTQMTGALDRAQIDLLIEADQPFLRDHLIAGQSILPGVMYLELARAAVAHLQPQKVLHGMAKVSWVSPLVVTGSHIQVSIVLEGLGLTGFKIMEQGALRASGQLVYEQTEPLASVDIAKCIEACPHVLLAEGIYDKMAHQGLKQGPSLRVLTQVNTGPNSALAAIELNASENLGDFVLHPSLMDAVFQTVVVHHFSEHLDNDQQYLPTALESVRWFKPLEAQAYAYVEELPRLGSGQLLKYKMSLLNTQGDVMVQFEGFSRRPLRPKQGDAAQPLRSTLMKQDFYYCDEWEAGEALVNRTLSKHLLLLSNEQALQQALAECLPEVTVLRVSQGLFYEKHNDNHYEVNPVSLPDFLALFHELKHRGVVINELIYAWTLFDLRPVLFLTQALMQSHVFKDLLMLYTYPVSSELSHAQQAMAAGFGRTLLYENPQMAWRSIETANTNPQDLAKILADELRSAHTSPLLEVSYAQGPRQIRRVRSAPEVADFQPKASGFNTGGRYLITGGAGGLGQIIAQYLATHYQAHLILVGRSAITPAIQQSLDALSPTAASVHYLSADVTQVDALKKAFLSLPSSLQAIDGVIHAAGLKQDSFILKKEPAAFHQVMMTKVKGALSLDELTQAIPLDFMLLFSSIAALIPNQGQSDYAAANSFLDSFSRRRNVMVREGLRQGVTLAINWPLWASGGMQVTPEQEDYLKEEFGMEPLTTALGLQALEQSLSFVLESPLKRDQLIVIDGDKSKIQAAFDGPSPPVDNVQPPKSADPTMAHYLKKSIASVLHVAIEDIDPAVDFERYGINSIVITEINTLLEARFPNLPKTLFFEYPNLNELLGYFNAEVDQGLPVQVDIQATTLGHEDHYTLVDSVDRTAFDSPVALKNYTTTTPYIMGFSYHNKPAVPGACFLEMARQSAAFLHPDTPYVSVINNYWPTALEIEGADVCVRTKLLDNTSPLRFEISTLGTDQKEIIHATGALATTHQHPKPATLAIQDKINAATRALNATVFYDTIHHNADLRLAGIYRPVNALHVLDGEAIACLVLSDEALFEAEQFVIHPIVFTGLEQSLLVYTALTHEAFHASGMHLMPVSIEAVDLYAPFPRRCFLHLVAHKKPDASNKIQRFDVTVFDEQDQVIAFIAGNTMRITSNEAPQPVIETTATDGDTDVAIIGMSGRFPEAKNTSEFWENLRQGKDCISQNPLHQDLYRSSLTDKTDITHCPYGASLSGVDEFDPAFFGIAPVEGALIDPQERLFLQVAWEALHDAHLNPKEMSEAAREIGVYVGVIWQDYQLIALEETLRGNPVVVSSLLYSIANRVSYTFNFTGPSLSVDTACSSSLTALHLACQSILLGEIKTAIVGGVNLNLHPMKYAFLNNYDFLSSEGRCRSYGEGGNGYVPGEGIAALVIKSLKEAIKDGDPIYAIIKGSAINHGGKTRGYTVPNPTLQSKVILAALKRAKINPRDISYVEGHGTGTALGDPIEVRGLDLAYSHFTHDKQYCALGSVKSNIGHLEAAAGMASLIKLVLQMNHKMLVPSLHAEILNKNVDFNNTPFYVQKTLTPWESKGPRLGAVSSFGAGGSYAHVILESYPITREISLPVNPFHPEHYWVEQSRAVNVHPLLGEMHSNLDDEITYLGKLNLAQLPYLKDHQVFMDFIFPGAGYIEMMLAAGALGLEGTEIRLESVSFESALRLDDKQPTAIQVLMSPVDKGHEVVIYSQNAQGAWHAHARGTIITHIAHQADADFVSLEVLKSRCSISISKQEFYAHLAQSGLCLGANFQTVTEIHCGVREAFTTVALCSESDTTSGYFAHPALLDGCFQTLFAAIWEEKKNALYLPTGCDAITIYVPLDGRVFVSCTEAQLTDTGITGNMTVFNASGTILATIRGFHLRQTTEIALKQMLSHELSVGQDVYEWAWQDKSLEAQRIVELCGRWLILSDGLVSDALVLLLSEKGVDCRVVPPSDHPQSKEAFVALLNSDAFNAIVHLSSIRAPSAINATSIKEGQELGLKSVLHLTQAMIEMPEILKSPLFLVTQNSTTINLAQSPLNGFVKTILAEQSALKLKQIDLGDEWSPSQLLSLLCMEDEERLYRLNTKACQVPRLMQARSLQKDHSSQITIRSDAMYLITGGLGGLGISLAKWLIAQGAGQLFLTGRRPLNDEMKVQLAELEKGDTGIRYAPLDLADEQAVATLLTELQASQMPLKGIFHLAGIVDDATLAEQDWVHFERVFAAKVYGSFYLHQYSKELDLFVLFSSIASSLGNPGQSNYASANAFMDGLARYREQQGLPVHSLSWGPWDEVGMAKALISQHAKKGLIGLKPDEALRAMEFALCSKKAEITIAHLDWTNYLGSLAEIPTWFRAYAKQEHVREDILDALDSSPPEAKLATVTAFIGTLIRRILGFSDVQPLDEERGFFDMGLDSLMAVELKNRIQGALGKRCSVSTSLIFDYATIKTLSHHLATLLGIVTQGPKVETKSTLQLIQQDNEDRIAQMDDEAVLEALFKEDKKNG